MIRAVLAVWALACSVSAQTAATDPLPAGATWFPLSVVWPPPGEKLPFVERSFTFGQTVAGSTLVINGTAVDLDPEGVFFAMVRFDTGPFTLDYQAIRDGVFSSTRVSVEVASRYGLPPLEPDAVKALEPAEELELRAGDTVVLRCLGPAGGKGVFRIKGLSSRLPMAEAPGPVPGIYEGHYRLQERDRGEKLELECGVKTGFFGGPSDTAKGRLTVLDPGQTKTALTRDSLTVLKTLEGGYTAFYPPGIKLEITGRRGGLLRAALSEHESGWVDAARVTMLPEGTPPPRGRIGRYLNAKGGPRSSTLFIEASERLPFEVRQTLDPLRFELRFFGAEQRFDRIRFDSDDPVIRSVSWRQESSRVVLVTVETRLAWGWGYRAEYDAPGRFTLEIRRPPDLSGTGSVFRGRRVALDPGHGPSESAVGPRGTTERDINLAIAERMRQMLLAEGAEVYLTRVSSEGPPLIDRTFLARDWGGEVYVSVHNNAFPANTDPFEAARGYMHFYYHPQSRALAEAVRESYAQRHPELADESLRWGDLYVCRMTEMPSILTESAYMILPEQEKLLRDPKYQDKLARTLVEGLRRWYRDYRELQKASPAEQAAAVR